MPEPHWAKDLVERLAARQAQKEAASAAQQSGAWAEAFSACRDAEPDEPAAAAETGDTRGAGQVEREQPEPEHDTPEEPGWVKELAERYARAKEKLAEREAVQVPSEDPEAEGLGQAWPGLLDRERDPLLHPAELDMLPSAGVLAEASRQAGRQAEADGPEAGG